MIMNKGDKGGWLCCLLYVELAKRLLKTKMSGWQKPSAFFMHPLREPPSDEGGGTAEWRWKER